MTEPNRPKALYILSDWGFERIYGADEQRDIAALADVYAPPLTPQAVQENPALLEEVEIIFSGWGGPRLDRAFLEAAPNLRAFFYGAGATGGMIHAEAWERGITVTSAAGMNAIPVAEYTVAAIICALKQTFRFMREIHAAGRFPAGKVTMPGAYKTTVGIISLGAIGRAVVERLRWLDVSVIACDPFVSAETARDLQIELVSLEEVFARAEVVSLHTPWLPETERMIRGSHFSLMKPDATFINTARGAVIAEDEMIAVLARRPDLTAILDVTHPEPPIPGSPLYTLPNVFLTPHTAGSGGAECRRMGRFMAEELARYCRGEALQGLVTPEAALHTSHRVPSEKA